LKASPARRVIFAGLTMVDFQKLRLTTGTASAPLMAVSIFLE
jgi:FtsH-binding integral membrane protein